MPPTGPEPSTGTPPIPQGARPDFSLVHLGIWVATSAIYTACWKALWFDQHPLVPAEATWFVALQSVSAGGAWLLVGLAVWETCRGRPLPRWPGEWLLVVLGLQYLFGLLSSCLFQWQPTVVPYWPAMAALSDLSWLWPAWRLRDFAHWRALCVWLCLAELACTIALVFGGIAGLGSYYQLQCLARMGTALVASWGCGLLMADLRRSARPPWTHCLGPPLLLGTTLALVGFNAVKWWRGN